MKKAAYVAYWVFTVAFTLLGIGLNVYAHGQDTLTNKTLVVPPTWQQAVREHLAACHPLQKDGMFSRTFTFTDRCERSETMLRALVEGK